MPSPSLVAAASTRSPEDVREGRRKAALQRLKQAGEGLSPALAGEGQAALANAFSLSDLFFNGMHDGKA